MRNLKKTLTIFKWIGVVFVVGFVATTLSAVVIHMFTK